MNDLIRCDWGDTEPEMMQYHDLEWGVPVPDDNGQFEHMILEVFQAGLSWRTVLRKRESFRSAFRQFDPKKVAAFTGKDIDRLLGDAGIIRNRLKIESTINNAARFLEVSGEFGSYQNFIIQYKPKKGPTYKQQSDLPAFTPESEALSKELKTRGFKFVGATTVYAHMQSVGIVNDHQVKCYRFEEIEALRRKFIR